MKFMKYTLLISLAIALSLTSGCTSRTYKFDFTSETTLSRADGDWITDSLAYSLDEEDGLVLKGINAAAPHYYNGDFTVSVVFELKEDAVYDRGILFILSSEIGYPPPFYTDWLGALLLSNELAEPEMFYMQYATKGSTVIAAEVSETMGILNYPGINELVIYKKGNKVNYELNGDAVGGSYEITGYNLDWFCPQIRTFYEAAAPWGIMIFKSFEVEFKGDQARVE